MYSRLDSIFRLRNERQTEHLDTRYNVHRQNDQKRKNKEKQEDSKADDNLFGDDGTELSVMSLRTFVKNLLGDDAPKSNQDAPVKTQITADETAASSPNMTTHKAAMAANAYQKTHETTHPESVPEPDLHMNTEEEDTADLTEDDKVILRALLKDLRTLAGNHITHIRIEPDDGDKFVENLIGAVKTALKP